MYKMNYHTDIEEGRLLESGRLFRKSYVLEGRLLERGAY